MSNFNFRLVNVLCIRQVKEVSKKISGVVTTKEFVIFILERTVTSPCMIDVYSSDFGE